MSSNSKTYRRRCASCGFYVHRNETTLIRRGKIPAHDRYWCLTCIEELRARGLLGELLGERELAN